MKNKFFKYPRDPDISQMFLTIRDALIEVIYLGTFICFLDTDLLDASKTKSNERRLLNPNYRNMLQA